MLSWEEIEQKYCPLEIDKGWFNIVEPIFEYIENANKENNEENSPKIEVRQCKEKFGTLRFYTTNATEELNNLIKEAERLSWNTCEVCGKPGKLRHRNYWLKTVCDKCAEEYGYSSS